MAIIKTVLRVVFLIVICFQFISCTQKSDIHTTAYFNGYVFDGMDFNKIDFLVKDGKFIINNDSKADTIIDLNGQYIIPPFGDAHTHNFDNLDKFDSIYASYINEGTFYVQVLTNHYSKYLKIKDSLNLPGKIDVKFAHGGLTSTGGHPHNLYESQALDYSWRAMFDPVKKEKILSSRLEENDAYYLIDSVSELEEKWETIVSKHPDFIKIYIMNTENRDQNITTKKIGSYGLSLPVIKSIIKKAKADHLTIYAHVESAKDFEIAIDNGIQYFAHMPGYGGGIGNTDLESITISDSLLKVVSQKEITIVPTVSFAKYYSNAWDGKKMTTDTTLLNKKKRFLKTQLQRFQKANINLVIGADQNNVTITEELEDLKAIDAFSNLELLNILINTSKTIFPNRKIGEIKNGYEASFLVLKDNPLEGLNAVKTIQLRIKNGIILTTLTNSNE